MDSSIQAADLFSVNGLVAVITGGGSGIGLMMAKALEQNGAAKVYIVGRRLAPLQAVVEQSKHGNLVALQGDVTSKADLERIVEHVKTEHGFLNLLISNAGISGPDLSNLPPSPSLSLLRQELWSPSLETFSQTFTVNVAATFFTIVAFLELLDAGNKKGNVTQRSQVVATSSISGFNRNVPGGFAYGGSKSAVTQMMKQFATLLAPYGIRSNVIAPGIYPSEMTSAALAKKQEKGDEKVYPASVIPEQRMGNEQDMAGVILFLASRAGGYCNGNVVLSDGGRLSVAPASY